MLRRLARRARRAAMPTRSGAPRIRSSPTATPSARSRWARMARELELAGVGAGAAERHARPLDALEAEYARVAAALHGAAPCVTCTARPARLLVVDDNKVNRLLLTRSLELQGHSVASARERPRGARDAARASASTSCCSTWKCPRWTASRCWSSWSTTAQLRDLPVIVTSSLEGVDNIVRCIELGAEDYLRKPVNPGAAQGAHRREPREEAPARPAEGTGAALRHARRWRRTCRTPGFSLGGKRVRGVGDVLRHPRLHRARRVAAARGDDRAAQHLLHADVRRDQRPRRRRHPDDRRRADGDLRRAAAAGRSCARARCARRWR